MAARRRLRKETAHLEITAFINLIVVLVPFLLSTAVFSRLAVIDISLPAKNTAVEQLKVDNLQLEVVLRPDSLEIGDRIGGLIQRIPNTATGYDTAALSTLIQQIKAKFPDKVDASVLAEPNTPYDALVQVMDSVRVVAKPQGATILHTEMFPNISIGDAPVVKR
ncbi:biopolymer transporter ExbD [Rhizobacter sp. SG703]|uniref:ExbD/TolR family protein n=1 Tax=Rhizobacter sp. SG703 TaxID=2587140 RepID=UPI001444BCD3|nr:biopolymer transporter ExbD [Rhizobacter sp. SG703]NKI92551.1 biopolymer transport protein ExbD [Rhizobacter sp. SG703]